MKWKQKQLREPSPHIHVNYFPENRSSFWHHEKETKMQKRSQSSLYESLKLHFQQTEMLSNWHSMKVVDEESEEN